jgi:hypothetical protein
VDWLALEPLLEVMIRGFAFRRHPSFHPEERRKAENDRPRVYCFVGADWFTAVLAATSVFAARLYERIVNAACGNSQLTCGCSF